MRQPQNCVPTAFERDALPHYGKLRFIALSFTQNDADADDLTQETFLKAFRFWDSYEPGTNVYGWLVTILRNTFINEWRQQLRTPMLVSIDAEERTKQGTHRPELAEPTANDAHRNFIGDTVQQALEALPDEFRTAVILCDIEELPYDEVAEICHCPLGTVRSRLHRAREILQLSLGGYAEQHGHTVTITVPFLKGNKDEQSAH